MAEHTRGKLRVAGDTPRGVGIQAETDSHGFSDIIAIAVAPHLNDIDHRTRDDARRLVACWNALEGISTEDIENGNLADAYLLKLFAKPPKEPAS